jgi:hypothetical protein
MSIKQRTGMSWQKKKGKIVGKNNIDPNIFHAVLQACKNGQEFIIYPKDSRQRLDVLACVLDYARRDSTNFQDPFVMIWKDLKSDKQLWVAQYLVETLGVGGGWFFSSFWDRIWVE